MMQVSTAMEKNNPPCFFLFFHRNSVLTDLKDVKFKKCDPERITPLPKYNIISVMNKQTSPHIVFPQFIASVSSSVHNIYRKHSTYLFTHILADCTNINKHKMLIF